MPWLAFLAAGCAAVLTRVVPSSSHAGILDIFGFEIFKVNSFEQLCINFTNEKLQQFFNAHTFKKEEAVYRQEKIAFDHVEYIDNQPVLDLIEQKPNGILPSLDEELRIPRGTDQTYVTKLHGKCKGLKHYQAIISCELRFPLSRSLPISDLCLCRLADQLRTTSLSSTTPAMSTTKSRCEPAGLGGCRSSPMCLWLRLRTPHTGLPAEERGPPA